MAEIPRGAPLPGGSFSVFGVFHQGFAGLEGLAGDAVYL